MAHRPIAIDGAGADGSVEGAGGVEPGSSNDHGGDGACIDQAVVPMAPPCLSADFSFTSLCISEYFCLIVS